MPIDLQFATLGDCGVVATAGPAAGTLADALRLSALPGVTDVVAAFDAVSVVYDPVRLEGSAYHVVCEWIRQTALQMPPQSASPAARTVKIPVSYGGDDGPDLAALAAVKGLSQQQIVRLHTSVEYAVLAIGFMPGFAYLGGLAPQLHTPRLATPRPRVPAGSVAIGASYTGIYPFASPGGWNIIGRTACTMFDPSAAEPSLLRVGDRVKFLPIHAGD